MLQTNFSKFILVASSLIITSLIVIPAHAGWWDDAVSNVKSWGGEDVVEQVINTGLSNSTVSVEDRGSSLIDLVRPPILESQPY